LIQIDYLQSMYVLFKAYLHRLSINWQKWWENIKNILIKFWRWTKVLLIWNGMMVSKLWQSTPILSMHFFLWFQKCMANHWYWYKYQKFHWYQLLTFWYFITQEQAISMIYNAHTLWGWIVPDSGWQILRTQHWRTPLAPWLNWVADTRHPSPEAALTNTDSTDYLRAKKKLPWNCEKQISV